MISKSELLRYVSSGATWPTGEQRRFDHHDCPAGVDTRQRLYILKKTNDLWLGYCHNCGETGVLGTYGHPVPDDIEGLAQRLADALQCEVEELPGPSIDIDNCLNIPSDLSTIFTGWAQSRMLDHYTTSHMLCSEPYGWRYSPLTDQIYTPIKTAATKTLVGWQARNAPGVMPKCKTHYLKGYEGHPLIYPHHTGAPWVIVEDPLSAVRMHYRGFNAMALLGTNLNEYALKILLVCLLDGVGPDKTPIYVWLDDDTAGQKAAVKVMARISSLLNTTHKLVMVKELEPSKNKFLDEAVKRWT